MNHINLNLVPEKIIWPTSHYLFIEKVGDFMITAQAAWKELHDILPLCRETLEVKTCMSLYKIQPEMIYRAGIVVSEKPEKIPAGLRYEYFEGGSYLKYTHKGSYSNLPEACALVFEKFAENNLVSRDSFYIEHYANDPEKTPEADLITEILFPV